MATNLLPFFLKELRAHGVQIADTSGATNFQCYCFKGHDAATASLSIRKSDGAFYCFGCRVKGKSWNTLAHYIGAQPLSDELLPDPLELIASDLDKVISQAILEMDLPWDLRPWKGEYRGLPESFLLKCDSHRWFDPFQRCQRILWPCWQNEELLGWAARRLDKKKEQKYRNAPGMSSTDVLFPYDVLRRLLPKTLRRTQTVVLVEGQFDALRLINNKIPALAILGTNNFRSYNYIPLLNLDIRRVILATDSDPAGKKARPEILADLKKTFDVEQFFPPHEKDPGNMPDLYVKRLHRQVFAGTT